MITRIVRMDFQSKHIETFLQIFSTSKQKIRDFPGCNQLELHRDCSLKTVFYTISLWESKEALEKYRKSELFQTTWAQTKLLFQGPPFAYSLDKIEAVSCSEK